MNVFVLDSDLRKSAEYYTDKDLEKTIKIVAQLLASTYYYSAETIYAPYKLVKGNRNWITWLRVSASNWMWLCDYGIELYGEYKFRYNARSHRSGELIFFMSNNKPKLSDNGLTTLPIKSVTACIDAYMEYVNEDSVWTKRDVPWWYT